MTVLNGSGAPVSADLDATVSPLPRTTTPGSALPPLPDSCYPPGATPLRVDVPTAEDFLLPDPPRGRWKAATSDEHQAAWAADQPCAYVEWCASNEVSMHAHFVIDGAAL